MKPFFKWSGGKRKELDIIKAYMPKSYDTFYEPFVGGGALWLDLCPYKAVVNDNYDEVINFYRVLGTQTDALKSRINDLSRAYGEAMANVIKDPKLEHALNKVNGSVEALAELREQTKDFFEAMAAMNGGSNPMALIYNKYRTEQRTLKRELNKEIYDIADEYYYHFRDNDFDTPFDQAVRFYILRQLSFSGMLRFGPDGKFNVPFGWYKTFKGITEEATDIKSLWDNTTFRCMHWKDAVKDAGPDDFVFLDPPYTRKFKEYHVDGEFNQPEHKELAEWFRTTDCKAMVIINKDDFTSELYEGYEKEEHDKAYNIRYRKDRMKKEDINAVHLIATNYSLNTKKKSDKIEYQSDKQQEEPTCLQ